ncbi:MAG: hypothetical protein Q7S35_02920 [Candidatus Limnocylindrales bacterium]|nr:hypothetical protein [Candidatus Limnocylindrales bacterium]
MDPDPKVVTISREALRADLAELELRLRLWIGSELIKKADEHDLENLKVAFAEKVAWADSLMPLRDKMLIEHNELLAWQLESYKGHFTEAQAMTMVSRAKDVLKEAATDGWTKRERMFALVAGLATAVGLVVNIFNVTGSPVG